MFFKYCIGIQLFFFHSFGHESLYSQLKPLMDLERVVSDIRTRFKIHLSIDYTFPIQMRTTCLSMAGDKSYFASKFYAEVALLLPPIVLLDTKDRFKCGATMLVAEDVHSLSNILRKLPRFPTQRIWCIVNNNTLGELEEYFKKNLSDFGDANLFLMVLGDYDFALKIGQPDRDLKRIKFPHRRQKWPIIENYIKTFSGREIKYSTAKCDIHSTYVPALDSYWGLDWKIFEAIAKGMKLTPKFVELPQSKTSADTTGTFINGTWEGGILGNIALGIADIGFCGFVIESTKFRGRISMGNPIRDTCIIYAVPHPKKNLDDWTVIFYSFNPTVHIFLGISIISFVVVIRTVANINFFQSKTIAGYKSLGYCLNVAWGVVLQGNFPNPCRMGTLRPFLLLWAMFSVLITNSFSSHLVSNFARPLYNPKPKTVEDLVKFGYESPQVDPFPLGTIIDPEEPNTHEWLNRLYAVKDHEQMVAILDTKPNQALFGFKYDDDVFIPFIKEAIPERVMEKYETMDKCIVTIYEGFAFRRGSPFLKPFNDYSVNLLESGFLSKFTRDILVRISMLYPSLREATNSQSSFVIQPLSVFHLKGIFVALILGNFVATLTLIGEVIFHFESNKYRASRLVETKPKVLFHR